MAAADRCNASLVIERGIDAAGGEQIAYVTPRESLTYDQLRRQANRMGHLLRDLGVRREQRVLLVLDDTIAFPIAFLGALRIGAVPVPVSVRETADNFRHFIDDSYAEVVVCDADMLPTLHAALADRDVRFLARGAHDGTAVGQHQRPQSPARPGRLPGRIGLRYQRVPAGLAAPYRPRAVRGQPRARELAHRCDLRCWPHHRHPGQRGNRCLPGVARHAAACRQVPD